MTHSIIKAKPSSYESGVVVAETDTGIKILFKFETSTLRGEKTFAKKIIGRTTWLTPDEETTIRKYPRDYRIPERWFRRPSDLR